MQDSLKPLARQYEAKLNGLALRLAGRFLLPGRETIRSLTSMKTLLRNVFGRGFDSRRLHFRINNSD